MSLLAQHYKFTVDEFVRMYDEGILEATDRVELLNGEIIIMHAVGYRHAQAVTALTDEFGEQARRRYSISPQNPVELEKYSAPQPDICLVARACRNSKRHPQPDQVDRGPKMAACALCGIREFWILNLQDDVLEIYRDPQDGTYREQLIVPAGGSAAAQAFPDVVIALTEVIPDVEAKRKAPWG